MHILRVVPTLDPEYGGPVEALLRSSLALNALGHRIEVATIDRPTDPVARSFPLDVHALGPSLWRRRYAPRFTRWIKAHRDNYDIVVLEGLWNYTSIGSWRGLRGGRTPYVIFTHGMLDPWFRLAYPIKHAAKQLYWLAAEGRVLRDAAAVLFTCEEERELAWGGFWGYRYTERIAPIGTQDPPPATPAQRTAFREAVPALGDRRYLLFLSRIHPKKGCDILVETFAAMSARHPDLDLVIAGPDQIGWRPELEASAGRLGIADRIHWPGMLGGDAKWGAFRGAEAFVLPSHSENFGIVVAEAMACGTPVVITDKVNIWREVAASGGGVVGADDVAGYAAVLEQYLALDESARRSMGAAARGGFLRHFEIGNAAAALDQVLREAAGR